MHTSPTKQAATAKNAPGCARERARHHLPTPSNAAFSMEGKGDSAQLRTTNASVLYGPRARLELNFTTSEEGVSAMVKWLDEEQLLRFGLRSRSRSHSRSSAPRALRRRDADVSAAAALTTVAARASASRPSAPRPALPGPCRCVPARPRAPVAGWSRRGADLRVRRRCSLRGCSVSPARSLPGSSQLARRPRALLFAVSRHLPACAQERARRGHTGPLSTGTQPAAACAQS